MLPVLVPVVHRLQGVGNSFVLGRMHFQSSSFNLHVSVCAVFALAGWSCRSGVPEDWPVRGDCINFQWHRSLYNAVQGV